MKTNNIWLITAISNLHAGSGDADYGIVDKHVQRDAVTGLPTIHASGIKGALREVFHVRELGDVTHIFGSENKEGKQDKLIQGAYHFFNARLLAFPVRSCKGLYRLATCPELIADFLEELGRIGVKNYADFEKGLKSLRDFSVEKNQPIYFGNNVKDIKLEDFTASYKEMPEGTDGNLVKTLFDDRLVLFNCDDIQAICDELPVIARNHLENGISSNLWYEEVVPRQTRFYAVIGGNDNGASAIEAGLKKLNNMVQIGGNATVGYGLCNFINLTSNEKKN